MKPLSEMTHAELAIALQSAGEELAALEEEREYLLRQVGRISGQAARRYEIRLNSFKQRMEEIEGLLAREG